MDGRASVSSWRLFLQEKSLNRNFHKITLPARAPGLDRIVHSDRRMVPHVSVIVAAFNRAASLRGLIDSLLAQDTSVPFEIIVADNGSTDDTPAVVQSFAAAGHAVRYVRENRRGVSYARNAGAAAATAPILAFTDDDQHVAANWVSTIVDVLREHPDVDAIGGRVLAQWDHPRPSWVTGRLLGPVSLFDRGDRRLRLHRRQWMCLPGGNLAVRREVFAALGGFNHEYIRSQDRELTVRLLLTGRTAMYVPELIVYHHLDAGRLTKRRFREWNACEGRMRAGYAFEELFTRSGEIRALPPDIPRVLGVSRFMYRRLAMAVAAYAVAAMTGRLREAFRRELRVRYLWSYIVRRRELARACPERRRRPRSASEAASALARLFRVCLAAGTRMVASLFDVLP
jgi:glucosyl-dolichyl phosphate glucuronosyltransferase